MVNERGSLWVVARELVKVTSRHGCSKRDGVAVGVDDVGLPWRWRAGEAARQREELLEGDGEGALEGGDGGLCEPEEGVLWKIVEDEPLHRTAQEPRDVKERERDKRVGNGARRQRDLAPVDDLDRATSILCHVNGLGRPCLGVCRSVRGRQREGVYIHTQLISLGLTETKERVCGP